jgi:glycosyltransferase involved in cell wall biosynthesis
MKARLLFISPEFPFPLFSGGCLRTFSLLRYLAERFEIHLVTFAEVPPDEQVLQGIRSWVSEVTVLPLQVHARSGLHRFARNLWRALRFVPPLVDRFAEARVRPVVDRLLSGKVDCVWLEHLWLAPYVRSIASSATKVLDVHNVESDYYRQLRRATRNPLERLGYYVFEQAARRVEHRSLALFDRIIAVSSEDRELLARDCPRAKIFVVPNAVKLGPITSRQGESINTLYFAGRLDYAPNREAVAWFYHLAWPLVRREIPGVKWNIVGAHPELLEEEIRRDPQVLMAGCVEKTEPYLQSSSLVIVPLTLGGGTRFKILEAWAAGKAVVSTTKGASGLAAVHGENIWVADHPEEFAKAAVRLLQDSSQRAGLGTKGWETVEKHYSWECVKESLEAALLSR